MKTILILFFLIALTCLIVCDEHKHLKNHKNKHGYYHKEKKINRNHKKHHEEIFGNQFKKRFKNKRAPVSITVKLDGNREIRGSVNQTNTEKATRFYHFQGIPYAKPPVGDLRFEPPQEYKLKGFYSATYQRNFCTQNLDQFGLNTTGAEDCLYLNIYTTRISTTSKLTVLVWIYGGTFLNGDGNYETYAPDNFIDQNVVFVTLNYRLGVFGFLSTGDDVVPGNMGLKDQAMALKWVQENIIYFGGDPNNVTIMGQSAGAVSVTYLVQSPRTKGLFHQAIVHSGNTLSLLVISRRAEQNFQLLATTLLIFGTNKTEIVRRMKSIDAILLAKLSYISMNIILAEDLLNGLVYAPVIEEPNPTEIFSYKSYEQLDHGNFTIVPMIIGYNSEEDGGSSSEVNGFLNFYFLRFDISPSGLVPLDMNVNNTQTKDKVGKEIKDTYYNGNVTLANTNGTVKYLSHHHYVRPTVKYVELYSKWKKRIYFYRFSYNGNSTEGVHHARELPYFFYCCKLNAAQKMVSNKVVTLWSKFIKTGNPTPSEEFNITWIPSSYSNNYSYLDIGNEFVVYNQSGNPDKVYLDKWEYWYQTYGNRPYDTY